MMKKWMLLFLLIGVVLWGANANAPKLAESGISQALSGKMDMQQTTVSVQANPGLKILTGRMDSVSLHGKQVRFGDLQLASLDCDLNDVSFDPLASLTDGKLTVLQARSGELSAAVSGTEVRRFLATKVKDLSDVQVAFEDGTVLVTGRLDMGGVFSFQTRLKGQFTLKNNKLLFIPSEISADGMNVQRYLTFGSIEVYDFSGFPLGIRPDTVTLQDDLLVIHGQAA